MYRTILLLLCGITIAMLATSCPRDKGDAGKTETTSSAKSPDVDIHIDNKTDSSDTTKTDATTPPTDATTANDAAKTNPPADMTKPPTDTTAPPADAAKTEPTAGMTKVVLETTKGNITVEVHPEWSPVGAAHFIELVNAKFYDGAPFFRVIDGFMAQVGIAADPKMNEQWMNKTINDEPVVQGNKPGYLSFGKTQNPNSRSTHIFINFADNSAMLDPQGFSAFAKVTDGMDILTKLFRIPDEALAGSGLDQGSLSMAGGMDSFKKAFPQADYIKKAYIQK